MTQLPGKSSGSVSGLGLKTLLVVHFVKDNFYFWNSKQNDYKTIDIKRKQKKRRNDVEWEEKARSKRSKSAPFLFFSILLSMHE